MGAETKADLTMVFIGVLLTAAMTMGGAILVEIQDIKLQLVEIHDIKLQLAEIQDIKLQLAENHKYLVILDEVKDDVQENERHIKALEKHVYRIKE